MYVSSKDNGNTKGKNIVFAWNILFLVHSSSTFMRIIFFQCKRWCLLFSFCDFSIFSFFFFNFVSTMHNVHLKRLTTGECIFQRLQRLLKWNSCFLRLHEMKSFGLKMIMWNMVLQSTKLTSCSATMFQILIFLFFFPFVFFIIFASLLLMQQNMKDKNKRKR